MKSSINALVMYLIMTFLFGQKIERLSYNKFFATSIKKFKSSSGELIIKDFQGNISIIGNTENEVSIVRKTFLTVKSQEKVLHHLEGSMKLKETEGEDGTKTIIVESITNPANQLNDNLEINLPNVFSIATRSQDGDLEILSIQGEINISNRGGNIDLKDLTGEITTLISDGNITASHISGNISISALNGSLQFEHLQGTLNAKTSAGNIKAENIEGSITLLTMNGELELYNITGREIYGQTNSGDLIAKEIMAKNTIDLHSLDGNLNLKNLNGNLEASTSIGEITIRNIKGNTKVWNTTGKIDAQQIFGSFNGRNSAGDIYLTKLWDQQHENHQIDLKTSSGNIDIVLPNEFPAEFTLKVLNPSRRPSEVIISDFPLKIIVSSGVSIAKGKNSDGLYKINLETKLGNICVKSARL